MNPEPPQRWQLVLEAQPADVPAVVRLRAALKVLLRRFRLKCVAVESTGRGKPRVGQEKPQC